MKDSKYFQLLFMEMLANSRNILITDCKFCIEHSIINKDCGNFFIIMQLLLELSPINLDSYVAPVHLHIRIQKLTNHVNENNSSTHRSSHQNIVCHMHLSFATYEMEIKSNLSKFHYTIKV